MITIDARKDRHEDFRSGSVRGAFSKYLLEMSSGDKLEVKEVLDNDGQPLIIELIRNHVSAIGSKYKCKFRIVTFDTYFGVFLLTDVVRKKKVKTVNRTLSIDARVDSYHDFRLMTLRGAVASHALKMKEGETVRVCKLIDKNGEEQYAPTVRPHLVFLSKYYGAIYSCELDRKDNSVVIKMIKAPERMNRETVIKEPIRRNVSNRSKVERVNHTINAFLTGRIGHEPRSA